MKKRVEGHMEEGEWEGRKWLRLDEDVSLTISELLVLMAEKGAPLTATLNGTDDGGLELRWKVIEGEVEEVEEE